MDLEYCDGEWYYLRRYEDKARMYFEQALHMLEQYKGNDPLNLSNRLFSFCATLKRPSEMIH